MPTRTGLGAWLIALNVLCAVVLMLNLVVPAGSSFHLSDFAQELADHYVVMERGAVVAKGLGKDMEANGVRRLVAI